MKLAITNTRCICYHGDCWGKFIAIGPDGAMYPCTRFAGDPRFSLGMINAPDTFNGFSESPCAHRHRIIDETDHRLLARMVYLLVCVGLVVSADFTPDDHQFPQVISLQWLECQEDTCCRFEQGHGGTDRKGAHVYMGRDGDLRGD